MKTAVEFLVSKLFDSEVPLDEHIYNEIEQAKEIEKEQIIDAVYYNTSATRHDDLPKGEKYYKDTFK